MPTTQTSKRFQWIHPDGRIMQATRNTDQYGSAGSAASDRVAFDGLSLAQKIGISVEAIPASAGGKYWKPQYPTFSGGGTISKNIVGIGDSLCQELTAYLPTLFNDGRTITNMGIGGDRTPQIAFRWGAYTPAVTVAGNSIPASGGVTLTVLNDRQFSDYNNGVRETADLYYRGIMQNQNDTVADNTVYGTLAGVAGKITKNGGVYTFTRTAAGTAVPISGTIYFHPNQRTQRELVLIWMGRNNNPETPQIERDLTAVIDQCERFGKAYIILNVTNSHSAGGAEYPGQYGYQPILNTNAMIARIGGQHVIPIRELLVGAFDPNIPQDVTDHSHDAPPHSLMRDDVHFKAAGYAFIAQKVLEKVNVLYPDLGISAPETPQLVVSGTMSYLNFIDDADLPGSLTNGNTIANKVSGVAASTIHGTLTRNGKGIKSTGLNTDYLSLPLSASMLQGDNSSHDFVLCMWLKEETADHADYRSVTGFGSHAASGQAQWVIDTGAGNGFRLSVFSDSNGWTEALNNIPVNNTPTQLALSWQGGKFQAYVNGAKVGGEYSVPAPLAPRKTGTAYDEHGLFQFGNMLGGKVTIYTHLLEDLTTSARTALDVVQLDYSTHNTAINS